MIFCYDFYDEFEVTHYKKKKKQAATLKYNINNNNLTFTHTMCNMIPIDK